MKLFKTKKKPASNDNQWHKDFKRAPLSTTVTQQGFEFLEDDNEGDNNNSGTKQGLSVERAGISKEQLKILKQCNYENTASELMDILKRSNKTKFRQSILTPLIKYGFFQLTIPDKPRSPKQKYRLTNLFIQKKT